MPWRLIGFILVFIIFLVFIGFNLENKCDINFGFVNLTEVPVFYTIFVSLALGILVTLPIILSGKKTAKKPEEKDKKPVLDEPVYIANTGGTEGANEPAPSYTGGKYFDKNKFKKKK